MPFPPVKSSRWAHDVAPRRLVEMYQVFVKSAAFISYPDEASHCSEALLNSWYTYTASHSTRQQCFISNWDVHDDEHEGYSLPE
jgi:hypothetical protein